jgi:hypothetical protein
MEEDETGGDIAYVGKTRNACKIFIRNSEGKRTLLTISKG